MLICSGDRRSWLSIGKTLSMTANPDPTDDAARAPGLSRSELVGARVTLRPNRPEFAPLLFAAAVESLDTVGRWLPWCHANYVLAEASDWMRRCEVAWEAGEEYEFSVFDRAGTYVGAAGLNQRNRDYNFANLGYWIRQSRQGEGLAVEVVGLLAAFGFEVVGLTRIEIVAGWENRPSRRVAEKAGASFECRARNRLMIGGMPVDAAMYALLPGDRR